MESILRALGSRIISVVALATALIAASPAVALASDLMPAAQQNALVQKYCAVCHTDASMNGGISLEHFDAEHADPGDAAMMAGKLKGGAFGAAGLLLLMGAFTQDTGALSAEAVGASEWIVTRSPKAAPHAPTLTARRTRAVLSAAYPESPDLFRLKLSCRADAHEAEMLLAWSPGSPPACLVRSAAVAGQAPVTLQLGRSEKMGNGTDGVSGPGAIVLSATRLPTRALMITNLFPNETVVFSFDHMTQGVRQELPA